MIKQILCKDRTETFFNKLNSGGLIKVEVTDFRKQRMVQCFSCKNMYNTAAKKTKMKRVKFIFDGYRMNEYYCNNCELIDITRSFISNIEIKNHDTNRKKSVDKWRGCLQ